MVPVRRQSRTRKNKRRSHHGMSRPNLVACPKCGIAKLPHAACDNCGYVSSSVALASRDEES